MQTNTEHFYNERARRLLLGHAEWMTATVPEALSKWIGSAEFHQGLFLGPRVPPDSIDEQISSATKHQMDAFSIEMLLNKVHIEDYLPKDFDLSEPMRVYFAVCGYFSRYLLRNGIRVPMVLSYCTDADHPDAEFPSHTIRFGFPRKDEDLYWLRPQRFDQAVVGTRISVVSVAE